MPEGFSQRLKSLMQQRKCTLKQVSEATGKSISAVQKWTAGGDITYTALRQLAIFFKVNWIWLRYGEEALDPAQLETQDNTVVQQLRRQFIADIQQREALLMQALNSAQIAAWQNDLITGHFQIINGEAVLGTRISFFDDILRIILPEDWPGRNAALAQALQNDPLHGDPLYECDYRIRRPDTQEIRWIHVRGMPLRDPSGRPVRMTGILYDITAARAGTEAPDATCHPV